MAGNPRSREPGGGPATAPEPLSSFEQMLASFAYSPAGTAPTVGGDDGAAGGTRKKRTKTKGEARPKGEKRSPASPQTPPLPYRRRSRPSSLPQSEGGEAGDGTTAAESAAMTARVTMAAGSAVASNSAMVEEVSLELVASPAGPGTPVVLPPDQNRGSSSSYLRKDVQGNPPTVSRFFPRHHPSAPTGGQEEACETRGERKHVEHMEAAGKEEGKGNPSSDGQNKGNQIGAAKKGKKRSKRSCGGASRPRGKNKVERDGQKKSKKKKVVVVSPYFVAASSDQRVTERGAGVKDDVQVVVQRKTKKMRTRQAPESAAEPRTSGGRQEGRPEVADGTKKKKRKRKHQSVQLSTAERMADAYKRVPDDNPWVPPFSDHELLQEFHFFDHWRVLVICMLLNRTTGREVFCSL